MISTSWQEVTLEESTSKIGDGLHGTPSYTDGGEYYFVNGNNLRAGRISIDSKTKSVNREEFEKYKKVLNGSSVLLSINGTIGNVALFHGEKVVLGKSACYLNASENTDRRYLRYLLEDNRFQSYIKQNATGTTIKNVSLKLVREYSFARPPLPYQEVIAHILGTLDDKIELNKKMSQTLEEIAKAIFKSWFVDFDPVRVKADARPTGLPPEISELFPDGLVKSEIGEVPKGWEIGVLSDLADVTMGQSPPGNTYNDEGEGLPFYQGSTDFGFRFPSLRKYCSDPRRFAIKDDVLLSVRAPVGDLNRAFDKCCIGRGLASIRSKNDCSSWTYYRCSYLKQQFDTFNSEGTVFGSINGKDLKSLKMCIPSNSIFELFEKTANPIDELIRVKSEEISMLTELRDTLLPKLISGQLPIPDAEKVLAEAGV